MMKDRVKNAIVHMIINHRSLQLHVHSAIEVDGRYYVINTEGSR